MAPWSVDQYVREVRRVNVSFDVDLFLRTDGLIYQPGSSLHAALREHFSLEPKFFLTHSAQRMHSVFEYGGVDYIIVDTGLLELLLLMNSVFYSEAPSASFRMAGCGYLAQVLQVGGLYELSHAFAREHQSKHKEILRCLGCVDRKTANAVDAVQEVYVLLHECGHLIAHKDDAYSSSLWRAIASELKTGFGSQGARFAEDSRKLSNRKVLQEEFVADALARVVTMFSRITQVENNPVMMFEAIYLAHLHLSFLQVVNHCVDRFSSSGLDVAGFPRDAAIDALRTSYAAMDLVGLWRINYEAKSAVSSLQLRALFIQIEKRHRHLFFENVVQSLLYSLAQDQTRTQRTVVLSKEAEAELDVLSGWPFLVDRWSLIL
jgi:hypothetical protein